MPGIPAKNQRLDLLCLNANAISNERIITTAGFEKNFVMGISVDRSAENIFSMMNDITSNKRRGVLYSLKRSNRCQYWRWSRMTRNDNGVSPNR